MNLKLLSGNSMLTVSGGWKEDAEIHSVFLANPVGAGLFRAMESSHDFLLVQLRRRVSTDTTLKLFSDDLTGLDKVFDRKSRSVYYGLEGLAEYADNPERSSYYRKIQFILFPQGLQVTRLSYRDEVGVAMQLKELATPEFMAELDAIPFGEHTLGDGVRDWIQAGENLGQKLRQRDRKLESLTKNGTATAELDPHGARLRWIRTVRALLAALDLMELSDSFIEQFLAPLKRAVAQAERTYTARSQKEDGEADSTDPDDLGDEVPADETSADDIDAGDIGDIDVDIDDDAAEPA